MPTYALILIILASVFVVLLVIYLIYMKHIFNKSFKRDVEIPLTEVDLTKTHYAPYIDKIKANMDKALSLEYEEVYVTSFDNLKLYARYYNKNSKKTVIFVHGYKATPYNNFATQLLSFVDHGYNALLIYQRAHGLSEGDYITMGANESKDLHNWIDKVKELYNPESIVLYGTSMGGGTVIITEGEKPDPTVKVIIDDCGLKNIKSVVAPKLKKHHIFPFLVLPIMNLYCKIFSNFDLKSRTAGKYIFNVKKPMVFIHSRLDDTVYIDDGIYMSDSCKNDKLLFFKDNAGHTSTFMANQEELEEVLYPFLDKYTK